jgi:HEAT repeat protein
LNLVVLAFSGCAAGTRETRLDGQFMRQGTLVVMLACAGIGRAQAPSAEELAGFARILDEEHLPSAGPELLKFFRDRTLSPEQITEISAQVGRLGSNVYNERTRAAAALVKAGQIAKPFLAALIKNPAAGAEAMRRAELCLRQINDSHEALSAIATAYLIARDKSAKAAHVLVHYLPSATDMAVIEAVQAALNALAAASVKPEPDLVAVLRDKTPAIRAAAAEALVRAGGLRHRRLVEHLLADPLAQVRLQVALALAEAKDKSAIPVLIELLPDLPADRAQLAEELLARLAGDDGPSLTLPNVPTAPSAQRDPGETPPSPRQVRAVWRQWWQKHQANVAWDPGACGRDRQGAVYLLPIKRYHCGRATFARRLYDVRDVDRSAPSARSQGQGSPRLFGRRHAGSRKQHRAFARRPRPGSAGSREPRGRVLRRR